MEIRDWFALGTFLVAIASFIFSVVSLRQQRNDSRFDAVNADVSGRFKSMESILVERSRVVDDRMRGSDMRFATLVAEVELFKDRVIVVENTLKHLPDKEVTHRLEITMAKMENELGKLSERMKPIASMADRMQEALLEKVMG